MTGPEYGKALKALRLSQLGAARLLGVNGRTSRRWIAGEVPIPRSAALVLLMMVKWRLEPERVAKLDKKRERSSPRVSAAP